LIRDVAVGPCVPRLANITGHARKREGLDVGWALEDVDVQAAGYVPGDVAMERPHAGVVLLELKHDIRVGSRVSGGLGWLEQLNVSHLGVRWVDDGAVPVTETLSKDVEVVSVHVHRMGAEGEGVLDDEADGGVGAEVEHVPFRWEGQVARIDVF
jgi:hypothetical protein